MVDSAVRMPPRWLKAVNQLDRLPEVWRCARRVEGWLGTSAAYLGLGTAAFPRAFRTRSGIVLSLADLDELVTAWVVFCRDEYTIPARARAILDIGANYGAFTLLAAASAPDARIVSVEPFPATFRKLTDNVAAHGLSARVCCWPVAVAAQAGARRMSADNLARSSARELLPVTASGRDAITVDTQELGQLIDRAREELRADRIDLLKMDVEGAEHEFLPYAAPEALACVGAWQMEYHPRRSKAPLFSALERAGLSCVRDVTLGPDYGVAHFARGRA